jgi:glutathione-specific gamma-glutamylcyclotransferase
MRRMALTAELVARCERHVDDAGPEQGYRYFARDEYRLAAEAVIQRKPPGDFWVFAYGSLIWKPEFTVLEQRRARAYGWHRAFTIELVRWRGTADEPGLMLALKRGGCCDGVAFRLPPEDQICQLERLLRREVDGPDQLTGVRWIKLSTADGPINALVFWAAPTGLDFIVDLPVTQVAGMLARACGHLGSGAAYLYNTVSHLEAMGIHDSGLWRLQELVATEILRAKDAPC